MRWLPRVAAALAALAAAGQWPRQQPPAEPEQPPAIKVEVEVVNVLCSVRDKRGALVKDLSQEDFEI